MTCGSPHLDEQTTAAPSISPGPVQREEWLIRFLWNPDHIVNGVIQPTAISLSDLKSRGFSVNRLRHVTQELVEKELEAAVARTSNGKPRSSEGVALFTARAVRNFRENGKQAFVAIDTALPQNPGHASIYVTDTTMKNSRARRMRKKLKPLLKCGVPVWQAFALSPRTS